MILNEKVKRVRSMHPLLTFATMENCDLTADGKQEAGNAFSLGTPAGPRGSKQVFTVSFMSFSNVARQTGHCESIF